MLIANFANLITFLNLVFGVTAIFFTVHQQWHVACWCILASAACDGVDGKIAKWLDQESEFGRLFDTCSDLISFGVAPSLLLHQLGIALSWPYLSWGGSIFFMASFFRLVRFYISRNETEYFRGLPTTAAASILAAEVLLCSANPWLSWILLYSQIFLSFFMISSIRVYNPKKLMSRFDAIRKNKL